MFAEINEEWTKSSKEKKDKQIYMHKIHKQLMDIEDINYLLKDSIIDKIEINQMGGACIVLNSDYHNIRMKINENDFEEVPVSILCNGNYEKIETNMVLKILASFSKTDNFVAFDVGANVGWYSLNLLKHFPGMRVYSFEPSPVTYERLINNIELNGFSSKNVFNIGLHQETGKLNFYYDREGSGASSLVNLREKDTVEIISVDMKKMDEWGIENGINKVDFIKCDVEGSELFVYRGGINLISENHPIIFSEMLRKWSAKFGYTPNDIIMLMRKEGYKCYVITESERLRECAIVDENTKETNFFFLHTEKHMDIIENLVS
jgi:methyltransferase, FkbM family